MRSRTHGHAHGDTTPTYRSWRSMLDRCYRVKDASYPRYGGVGVTVWEPWRRDFVRFLMDMGERPDGKTLDRIDGAVGYEPGNCRWATRAEQSANRRIKPKAYSTQRPIGSGTYCRNGHEYTPENTLIHKQGFRFCRQCKRNQQHRYYVERVKPHLAK